MLPTWPQDVAEQCADIKAALRVGDSLGLSASGVPMYVLQASAGCEWTYGDIQRMFARGTWIVSGARLMAV